MVAADRLDEVLATPSRPRPAPDQAAPIPAGPLAVEVAGLGFGYGDERVLDGVDLALAPGEVVALVGATGAGKSTLCHLLAHLYEPAAGTVRMGGVDLRHAEPDSIRAHVALAFQEAFLFGDSVRENLTLGQDVAEDDAAVGARPAPGPTASSPACPTGSTRSWASGASRSRAASASVWPWPGPCCAGPGC